jgi:hypothetical protein
MKERTRNNTNPRREQPLFCDRCFIRIAPYEQRVTVADRLYHSACYSRLQSKRTEQKSAA